MKLRDAALAPWLLLVELAAWFVRGLPTRAGVVMRGIVYRPFLRRAGRFRLEENVLIRGFGHIVIADYVSIMANSYIYAESGECVIGAGTSINNNVQLGANQGRIEIGRNVLIGPNCVMRAADHEFEDAARPIREQAHQGGTIVLEDDVWLGANVIVTKNVRIGTGAVVGAGSVVTRDIPRYAIAVGVPARVIRMRSGAPPVTTGPESPSS